MRNNIPRKSDSTNLIVSDRVKHNDDDTTQHIQIIVNCEVIETKKSKLELFNTGDKGSTQNLMSELIMELTNKRNNCSVNKKHKIICIGDSNTWVYQKVPRLSSTDRKQMALGEYLRYD